MHRFLLGIPAALLLGFVPACSGSGPEPDGAAGNSQASGGTSGGTSGGGGSGGSGFAGSGATAGAGATSSGGAGGSAGSAVDGGASGSSGDGGIDPPIDVPPISSWPDCTSGPQCKAGGWGWSECDKIKCLLDVPYGPHPRERLDIYVRPDKKDVLGAPNVFPLMIHAHGGGFQTGNKQLVRTVQKEGQFLEKGYALVSINYPLGGNVSPVRYKKSAQTPYPEPLLSFARAVQFFRYQANGGPLLNVGDGMSLDVAKPIGTGGSAGAYGFLWLVLHDDLADPNSADPVLRESSAIDCVASFNGQSTFDPRVAAAVVPNYTPDLPLPGETHSFYDFTGDEWAADPDQVIAEFDESFREASNSEHLDPSDANKKIFLMYDEPYGADSVHAPEFGAYLVGEDIYGTPVPRLPGFVQHSLKSLNMTYEQHVKPGSSGVVKRLLAHAFIEKHCLK